jgi:hypothetical protein
MDLAIGLPTAEQLADAHLREFQSDKDYPAALLAVDQGFHANSVDNVAQAIATLLRVWNRTYYRFRPTKKQSVESELEQLVASHLPAILGFRARAITSLASTDRETIVELISAFEGKLGPVGCAKSLNLLAPSFFPLWDNPIAYGYGVSLSRDGYLLFMLISKYQVEGCSGCFPDGVAPLKAIDEYNFCKYTLPDLASRRVARKQGSGGSAADKVAYLGG